MVNKLLPILMITCFMIGSWNLYGQTSPSEKQSAQTTTKETKPRKKNSKRAKKRAKPQNEDTRKLDEVPRAERTSTEFDFEETLLEGQMKAPPGLMLRGRIKQNKSQLIRLRENFRPELKKSRAGVLKIRPR